MLSPSRRGRKAGLQDFDYLSAIGEASASLGLISTLVFGIAVGVVLDKEPAEQDTQLLIYMSIATSMYTTTYSLLEFYYITTLRGVVTAAKAVEDDTKELMSLNADLTDDLLQDNEKLMNDIKVGFQSFNEMRQYARNSMWISLISIVFSLVSRLVMVLPMFTDLEPSAKVFGFCLGGFLCFLTATIAGFQTKDMYVYTLASLIGAILSAAVTFFVDREIYTANAAGVLVLSSGIFQVPLTVKAFRSTFLPLIKNTVTVY